MEEQLISFKTAKLAKEKGFVGLYPTTDYIPMYVEDDETFIGELGEQQGEDDCRDNFYLAVTQSLLQKWIREVHSIDVLVDKGFLSNKYSYEVLYKNDMLDSEYIFKTYEEALEIGLYEAIKLI